MPVRYDTPLQIILGVFSSPDRAASVRSALLESQRSNVIDIVGMALITRDDDGRVQLLEAGDASALEGEPAGSFARILSLIWGPSELESSSSRLHALAEALPPGSSAIAALIEHRWLDDVRALLEEAEADSVRDALRAEIAAALADDGELVLTAGAADWRAGPLERLRAGIGGSVAR